MAKLGACLWFPALWARFVSKCMRICLRTQSIGFPSAKAGTQVIVPFRDEDEKRHLKVMGDLGQIVPLVRLGLSPRVFRTPDCVCLPFGLGRNGT